MTDESAVARTITKLEILTHRNSHGPHWSAVEESPTSSSPASRASAMVLAFEASLRSAASSAAASMNPPKPTMASAAVIWPLRIACMASATVVVASSSKSVPAVDLRHSRRSAARLADVNMRRYLAARTPGILKYFPPAMAVAEDTAATSAMFSEMVVSQGHFLLES